MLSSYVLWTLICIFFFFLLFFYEINCKLGGNASYAYLPFRCLGYEEDKSKPGLLQEPFQTKYLKKFKFNIPPLPPSFFSIPNRALPFQELSSCLFQIQTIGLYM